MDIKKLKYRDLQTRLQILEEYNNIVLQRMLEQQRRLQQAGLSVADSQPNVRQSATQQSRNNVSQQNDLEVDTASSLREHTPTDLNKLNPSQRQAGNDTPRTSFLQKYLDDARETLNNYYDKVSNLSSDILNSALNFAKDTFNISDNDIYNASEQLFKAGLAMYNYQANNPLSMYNQSKLFAVNASSAAIPVIGPFLSNMAAIDIGREYPNKLNQLEALNKKLNDDSYVHDAFSSYVQKKNIVEVETSAGAIAINEELASYAQDMQNYADAVVEYSNAYDNLVELQKSGASREEILRAQDRVNNAINAFKQKDKNGNGLYEKAVIAESYNLGPAKVDLVTASQYITRPFLRYIEEGKPIPSNLKSELYKRYNFFGENRERYLSILNRENEEYKKDALKNLKELNFWQQFHTISDEFKLKEQAAQGNELGNIDTYIYSMPGVMGSSASYNGVQLAGMGFNILGQALMSAKNPYVVGAGVLSTAVGAGFNIKAGDYENDAEAASNYKDRLSKDLKEKGLYEDFITDGKKQLAEKGIKVKEDDDVLTHLLLKDWFPDNTKARNIVADDMKGLYNLWMNDMQAVSADVAIDTGLSIFAPYGPLKNAAKYIPIKDASIYSRFLRMRGEGTLANALEAATKEGAGRSIADTMSPAAGGIYRWARALLSPATSKLSNVAKPLAQNLSKRTADIVQWNKLLPAEIYSGKRVVGNAVDFAGRMVARGFSEAIEEGKQYTYGKMYANGEFDGKNKNMLDILTTDLSNGVDVGLTFLGHQFLGLEADSELMANMRGGFLGGLLNQNTFISTYQAASQTIKDVKAADVVQTGLFLQKYNDRSQLINAEAFAKYNTKSDYERMMKTFDDMERVSEQQVSRTGEGFSREDIENQREEYKKVFNLVNNPVVQEIAERRGIPRKSDLFRTFVSMWNYLSTKIDDAKLLMQESEWMVDELAKDNGFINHETLDIIFGKDEQARLDALAQLNEKQQQKLTDIQTEAQEQGVTDLKDIKDIAKREFNFYKNHPSVLAQYSALKQLIEEHKTMDAYSPEEAQKHIDKVYVYERLLDNLKNHKLIGKFIKNLDKDEFQPSSIREKVHDTELYDQLVEQYRAGALYSAQYYQALSMFTDLTGQNVPETDNSDLEYFSNSYMKYLLQDIKNRNKRDRARADVQANTRKLIDRYKNSVKSDEMFTWRINKDFRLHDQQKNIELQEEEKEEQRSEDKETEFNVEKYINSIPEEERSAARDELLELNEDGVSFANTAKDLVKDEGRLLKNKDRSIKTTIRPGVSTSIPIDPKYTYAFVRNDGSSVYLTEQQGKFVLHLLGVESGKNIKSIYQSPDVTLGSYEDDILDSIVNGDRNKFDKLIDKYRPYLSKDKIDYLESVWNDTSKDFLITGDINKPETAKRPNRSMVPVQGTHKVKMTSKQLREYSKKITDGVHNLMTSVFSIVTILGNYQGIVPSTYDEFVKYTDKLDADLDDYLNTIPQKNQSNVKAILKRKDDYGATNLQLIDLYIRLGFEMRHDKNKYFALAPTGESYKINKTQYEYAQYYKNRPSEPKRGAKDTSLQESTLNMLQKFKAEDNPEVFRMDLRTGWDYFFVEDGKLVRYNRLHSILKPQYIKFRSFTDAYENIKRELSNKFSNKDAFKEYVKSLEVQYNDELEKTFGKDSDVYKYNKISLDVYLTDNIINDPEIIESIAHIATIKKYKNKLDVADRAVIAGTIIDKICRDFFEGKTVVNDPSYKMPQKFFDKLIQDLTEQKKIYDAAGWKLISAPLVWRAVIDGKRIAGETDMVAVDLDGNIHVIDFKTSKYSFRKVLLQQEFHGPTFDTWDEVEVADPNKKLMIYVEALDGTHGKSQISGRTSRVQYAEQQTSYMYMIEANLQHRVKVEDAQLLVFLIKTKAGKDLQGEINNSVFDGFIGKDDSTGSERDDLNTLANGDGVQFQGSIEVSPSMDVHKTAFENVDRFHNRQAIQHQNDLYNGIASQINALWPENGDKVSEKTKQAIEDLKTSHSKTLADASDEKVINDKNASENIVKQLQNDLVKIELLLDTINDEIQKYNDEHPAAVPEKPRLNPNRKQSKGMSLKFNCLDVFDEKYVDKNLVRLSANPDFLQNAIFEIDVDDYERQRVIGNTVSGTPVRSGTPTVRVTIRYTETLPNGEKKNWVFDRVRLLFAIDGPNGEHYSRSLDSENASPLLVKLESLISDAQNKGTKIVLTKGNRTNGIVKYEGDDQAKSMQEAFSLSEEQMENAIYGTDRGVIGIVKRGSVYKTQPTRGQLVPLHGIDPDRSLTDGVVVWYMNLGYLEDNGSGQHSIPIALTPRRLHTNDNDNTIDYIINLLKNYTAKQKVRINGKEYDSPLSTARILRTLIRFGAGAEETGNDFIFDWAEKDSVTGYSTDGYRHVKIQLRGVEYIIDLHDDTQIENVLKPLLKNLYVYANNEQAMWHASVASRDASSNNKSAPMTNPFVGIESFFKQHPELTVDDQDTVIEFCDALKFRRSDVDPNLDGSYKGINGLHWMLKNGWLKTNFSSVVLPMFSFEDVDVVREDEKLPEADGPEEQFSSEEDAEQAAPLIDKSDKWNRAGDIEEYKTQQPTSKEPLNRELAEKRLRSILGNAFSIEFQDKAIDVLKSGWRIVAACRRDSITLTSEAENGVEFHEAFHAVVDLLIGEKRRKRIYDIYNHKYGNGKLSDTEISEGLADMYYAFRMNTQIDWNHGIKKMFNDILNWVRQFSKIRDIRLMWLFIQTNAGVFKNRKPDKDSVEAFIKRNASRKDLEAYTIRVEKSEINLDNFNSYREVDDTISILVYKLIRKFGIDNIGSNLEELKTDKKSVTTSPQFALTYYDLTLYDETEESLNNAVKEGKITEATKNRLLKFREIFDKWEEVQPLINNKLKLLGIDSTKRRKKKDRDEKDGGSTKAISDSIDAHSDNFFEHSRSEDLSAQIRYLLSTVPSVRYVTEDDIKAGITNAKGDPITSIYRKDKAGKIVYENGKPVRMTVPMNMNTIGDIEFQDFKEVYQKLLKHLYNVKDVDEMINKLNQLGEYDYVFKHFATSLYRFRYMSYVRDDNGIPKVFYKGKLVNPKDYISDLLNLTESEKNPTVVRYSHDVEEDGVIHKAGEIMQGAVIAVNSNYEALTTRLFQSIKSQHIDFTFSVVSSVIDSDGKIQAGKYTYDTRSTNTDKNTSAYPVMWFDQLRSLDFGLFTEDEDVVKINKDSHNAKTFQEVKLVLSSIQSQLSPNTINKMRIPGESRMYNYYNNEDFDRIETIFVSNLNKIGISITKEALNYYLSSTNPNITLQESFLDIFTSNENYSINPFIKKGGVLDKLQKAVDDGDVSMFSEDVDTKGNARANIPERRSGAYMYLYNGFVTLLAQMQSKYSVFYNESMVIGPENTKMYTFAENHSASDFTEDLNNTFDENGNIVEGSIMSDLRNSVYVVQQDEDTMTGSIIAKNVLNPEFNKNHNKLQLHTHAGLTMKDSRSGGTKYSEISAREDYLSKADILKRGNILFPTLSDKSTWFYLSGILLPGFNWNAKGEEFGLIPTFGKSGRMFYDGGGHTDSVGNFGPHPVLDLLIEYAKCELANIEKTMDDLGLNENQESASKEPLTDEKKVKNYHTKGKPDKNGNYKDAGMHGARFTVLTGVYDERTGKYIEFNKIIKSDPDLGVAKCVKLAKEYFFEKTINPKTGQLETDEELAARQRSQISYILQHRLDEELDNLVEKGIIKFNPRIELNKKEEEKLPRYMYYTNVYLDDSDIEYLTKIYSGRFGKKYPYSYYKSMAICAYVNDIVMKSIMSLEEVERIYSGMPQFFKFKYDLNGHLIDRGEDESKRFGGEGSTGTNNRNDLPNIPEEYTSAEIKDWEVSSPISPSLFLAFQLDEYRDFLANKYIDKLKSENTYSLEQEDAVYDSVYAMELDEIKGQLSKNERAILDEKIKAEAQSYEKDINVADGTAYITDKMAENLLRMRGAFDKKVEDAFKYLRNQNGGNRNSYLSNEKAYRIIHKALISTQKYSAFGYRMENDVPVHFYDKFALFPLFEGISYGFTKTLYEKMNDPENPVDMVKFESAVKSGSEGAQKFNPSMSAEEISNFSFLNHTYKLKYKFIRRQLNTDPRTDEEMSIGTQFLKIALSMIKPGQIYYTKDGFPMRGREIRDRIMEIQRTLSDIGSNEVDETFFTNKKSDAAKLSTFLKQELESREANKNVIDALDIITRVVGGEQISEFDVDLNSTSSMAWCESIINSFVNDTVIDINMPGNAYYQRSVFGTEGRALIEDSKQLKDAIKDEFDYTLNDGDDLQMINADGSMDAVISIDYFMHLIPENIKYDFKKARQFLIDNKIIGKDAETFTVSYRIPTQSVASIHALKFVDVLPVVRDTIILPKEFTKITGSDFKQILKSLNFFNCWEILTLRRG